MTRIGILIHGILAVVAASCDRGSPSCDPEQEYQLICDVHSTHDLLTMAEFYLGGNEPTGVDIIVHQGQREQMASELVLQRFMLSGPASSYIDQEGAEIFVWHYEIPLVNQCGVVEAFCGEELCPDNRLEFCFYTAGSNVSWYIIFKRETCRLQR
ncbi:MAG: hypothetical protein HYV42_00035 [Candidatus Magasanikbacteria bacterium]|nr:hypothetical protein [Candidatus Magasanikbacteria bacterium]